MAVNRPAEEDDPGPPRARRGRAQLFAPLKVQLFQERGADARALQGEIWRALAFRHAALPAGRRLALPAPGGPARRLRAMTAARRRPNLNSPEPARG